MRYEFLSNLELLGIKVLSVGYSNDTEITYAKCSRNQFIIHYVTDGIGYFNDDEIDYLKKNTSIEIINIKRGN